MYYYYCHQFMFKIIKGGRSMRNPRIYERLGCGAGEYNEGKNFKTPYPIRWNNLRPFTFPFHWTKDAFL